MFRTTAPVLVALLLVSACGIEPDDCSPSGGNGAPYVGEPMFDRCAGMGLAVDRPVYAVGDTLTLSVTFTPHYSGAARMFLTFLPVAGHRGQVGVAVVAPSVSVVGDVSFEGMVDVDAADRFEVPVRFVVRDDTPYHISATVQFLAVTDPATGESLVLGSDEQLEVFGPLDPSAYGRSAPLVLQRPEV